MYLWQFEISVAVMPSCKTIWPWVLDLVEEKICDKNPGSPWLAKGSPERRNNVMVREKHASNQILSAAYNK